MKALEPDFAELDGVIVQVERVIHLFRECGFEDLVAMVKQRPRSGDITWRRCAALFYGRRAAGRRRSMGLTVSGTVAAEDIRHLQRAVHAKAQAGGVTERFRRSRGLGVPAMTLVATRV